VLKRDVGKVKLSLWTFNSLIEGGVLHHVRQMFRRGYSYLVTKKLLNKTIREKYPKPNLEVSITGQLNEPLALTWSHVNVFFYRYAVGVILSLLCFALVLLAEGLKWRQRKTPVQGIKFKNQKSAYIFLCHFTLLVL